MNTTTNNTSPPAGSSILTRWRDEREAERAGISNSSELISSSDPRVLELFGVNTATSGMSVTATTAMRVSAVYACVTKLSGAVSTLPIALYRRIPGGRERVEDAPLSWRLNEQPSDRYSAASHWESKMSEVLLRGDGYTRITRTPLGEVKELVALPWSGVRSERQQTDESDRNKYFVQDGLKTYGCDQDDMLHFPGFGFDGLHSKSVIQWAARNATGIALAMDEYSGRFFADGAHPSTVLQVPGKMDPTLIKQLQQAFSDKYSGMHNAHKLPLVLTEGVTNHQLSISAEDAQLLDARKFQVVDIARAFGVPSFLIGDDAATAWGTGMETLGRFFIMFALQPHLRRIEQELNRKLFRTSRYFIEFDRDAFMQGDSKAQANYFKTALGGPGSGPGWMTPDEVRAVKNMSALGGKAAQLFYPDPKAKGGSNGKEEGKDDEDA